MGNNHPSLRVVNKRTRRPEFVERQPNQKRSEEARDLQFHQKLQEDIVEEEVLRDRMLNLRSGLQYRSEDSSVKVIWY